jgi:hypothetical protein
MIVTIRTSNGSAIGPMMSCVWAGKVVGGAAGVLGLAADVVKHVAWYLTHRIDSRPRERSEPSD